MTYSRFAALVAAVGACALVNISSQAAAETSLERGTYLMEAIAACGNCHTPHGGPMTGKELAGGMPFGGPDAPFTTYAANITPDKETGIGNWTDDQIVTAIREGKRPDGSIIGPLMPIPLYRNMSDSDVRAIVAYLRTVTPVKNAVPKPDYRMPLPPSYGPPVETVADVPAEDPVRYAAYLAGPVGHCIECHTPLAGPMRDFENQVGRGGEEFPGPWGVSVARNITPHMEDGIGAWSDADIKRAITDGVSKDGQKLLPPMGFAYYKNMTGADLDAIVAYLRTLKPLPDK